MKEINVSMTQSNQGVHKINLENIRQYLFSSYPSLFTENAISEVIEARAGMVNSVFKVIADNGNYYLKQFLAKPKDSRFANFTLSTQDRMGATEIAQRQFMGICDTGTICQTRILDYQNCIIIDEEIINAKPTLEIIENGKLENQTLIKIAENLSRIHKQHLNLDDFIGNRDFAEKKVTNKILSANNNRGLTDEAKLNIEKTGHNYLLNPTTLLHGDFCSTNILCSLDANKNQKPHFIDFEGAHFGNPSFDLSFLLAELIFFNLQDKQLKYNLAEFLENYFSNFSLPLLAVELTTFTGCMLLYLCGKGDNLTSYADAETKTKAQEKAIIMLNDYTSSIFKFIYD